MSVKHQVVKTYVTSTYYLPDRDLMIADAETIQALQDLIDKVSRIPGVTIYMSDPPDIIKGRRFDIQKEVSCAYRPV